MIEQLKQLPSPVGLRTLKTALAVSATILLVEHYGTGVEEVLFGVMGAFAAMEPTFKGAVRGCVAQFTGVATGVLLALIMRGLQLNGAIAAGVGIVLIMAVYKMGRRKSSPVLPCLILVTVCTMPEINALGYGLERMWNTTLGLAAGMAVNTLIFPYDTSKKVALLMAGLDRDLILFLEDLFDGDEHLPTTKEMESKMDQLERQLAILADQRLLRRRRQRRLLSQLQSCEDIARALLLEVEVLRSVEHPGRLSLENRQALRALGAKIAEPEGNRFDVEDLVVNYHVRKVLGLRERLKAELPRGK